MSSNATAGVGTRFRRWSGSAWEDIAEVNSITGPGMSRATIDVTSLDSTGGYREFIGSFRDSGDVSLNLNFTRAMFDLMKADFENDVIQNYEIVLLDADQTSFEFTGFVTECPLSISTDDKIGNDVTIKISGQVTVNSGASSGT